MSFSEFEPKETLFQYTSFEGFKGIVGSKSLWLSDLRSLNDPRELILGLGKVRGVLDLLLQENSSWSNVQLQKMLERSFDYVKSANLFTASFCPKSDSMPLWQHYGDDGKGVAIGFRPRAIMDMVGRLQKVEYLNDDSPLDDLKATLKDVVRPFGQLDAGVSLEGELSLVTTIVSRCTAIKHTTWDHESEVRLVYSQVSERRSTDFMGNVTGLFKDGQEYQSQEPSTRKTALGEVKYIPFKFGKRVASTFDPTSAISSVYIGSRSEHSVPEVKAILESEGFKNFKVYMSECIWR